MLEELAENVLDEVLVELEGLKALEKPPKATERLSWYEQVMDTTEGYSSQEVRGQSPAQQRGRLFWDFHVSRHARPYRAQRESCSLSLWDRVGTTKSP